MVTLDGDVALEDRSPNSSRQSLCRMMTSPPFLHVRACSTVKVAPHPSHTLGRFFGVSPSLSRAASRNSSRSSSGAVSTAGPHC